MDGSAGVGLLGGYRSDFARDLTKEGRNFAAFTAEVVEGPIASTNTTAPDVEVVRVANAFGPSGSVATLAALADLRSGADDAALVVGIGLEKTVPGAAWTGREGADARLGGALTGDYQVGDAKTFGTLNFGGALTGDYLSFVVSQPEGV